MAVRTRYRVAIGLSSDTTNEEKDLGNRDSEVYSDMLGEGGAWKTVLAASAGDTAVQLPQVTTAKFLMIRTAASDPSQTPGTITVKKNATTGEAWSITPLPKAKEGHFLISTEGVTAIFVANPGTVPMTVIVAMAGD